MSVSKIPATAVGDLAHTLVLERLDQLSQQLRDRDSHPLFIVSSVNYDNYLAKLQNSRKKQMQEKEKDTKNCSRERARNTSGKAESPTGREADRSDPEGEESEERWRLPPRPADRGNQRGEIDVLLLHEQCGVILTEVSDGLV